MARNYLELIFRKRRLFPAATVGMCVALFWRILITLK
jgi:hypothetical protein